MGENTVFGNTYQNKKVLVTGHTGFKGAWLTMWLLKMGAKVIGVSKDIPTIPSMFVKLKLESQVKHHFCDIRNLAKLNEIIVMESPDFIFHLAAQPIVSVSYADPVETITSNAIGTMNLLEVLRNYKGACTAIMITSDKCYDNIESIYGYKETDGLGGKDIYSGSKGMAELVIKSYVQSFFTKNNNVKIAIGRAGNVIGGGDWAKDRIVVDCVLAWSSEEKVEIRSPNATRPWQHVLEPLSGYLLLGKQLSETGIELQGEPFNFGPRAEQNRSVKELITDLAGFWGFSNIVEALNVTGNIPFHEAGLLKLNCDKALFYLKWQPSLNYDETIQLVGDWYYSFYHKSENMFDYTIGQINEYESIAQKRKSIWTIP
jgi:CDP-glucose 4,6-dehydratase